MDIKQLEQLLNCGNLTTQDLIELCTKANEKFLWHPLGFVSCTFIRHPIHKARLHIWPTHHKKQADTLDIHDHTFDFKSWVIQGAIESQTFTICSEGKKFHSYNTSYTDAESVLTKTHQEITVRSHTPKIYSAGDKYFFSSGPTP